MKVCITGGAGYLGSVLTKRLLSYKHKVVILDNFRYGAEHMIGMFTHPDLLMLPVDIRNYSEVEEEVRGSDVVVHLAALVGDPVCKKNTKLAYSTNVTGTLNVFEAAAKANVRKLIFASTCSNYGKMDRSKFEYLDEDAPLEPLSSYAEHKVTMEERLMKDYSVLNPTVLRFATLYGISPRMRFDLTVNQFAMEAVEEGRIDVWGPNFYRPYLHVMDASNVIANLLGLPFSITANTTWIVGSTRENYTKREIIELLKQIVPTLDVLEVHKTEDPRDYKVSFEKIKSDIGFRPLFNVGVGLAEIIDLVSTGLIREPRDVKWRNV